MTVDLYASETHFFDHLEPVWTLLPEEVRGRVLVCQEVEEHAVAAGLEVDVVSGSLEPSETPVLVASIGDFRRSKGRPRILSEHGAGQTYSDRNPSYAGGIGRDGAVLFLVPNHHAARRNRARYPRIPNAVVGSPRVDLLRRLPEPQGVLTACVSFHWRCQVSPEAGTAFDHYAGHLATAREALALEGVRLVAHAHPRLLEEARPVFESAGLEVLDTFEDVVTRCHVYAVDNSSTLFEFAALDRPVVVLNSPRYRRGVRHGLRFWDAADVGRQVDHPADLAAAVSAAAHDPDADLRSREAALGRVYPVRDGTSALRAAGAVLEVIGSSPGRCPVCRAGACSCATRPTTVRPVDDLRRKTMTKGPTRAYPNPNGPGMVRLTDETAERMGLLHDRDVAPVPEPAILASAQAAAGLRSPLPPTPEGAMAKAGPTARARGTATAPHAPDPQPQPDEGDDAKTKKRAQPADRPSSRRRRPTPAAPK